MGQPDATFEISYLFRFSDQREIVHSIRLDSATLAMIEPHARPGPGWTSLSFHQCTNCPLPPEGPPQCPIAVRLAELVETFRHLNSFEEVTVTVQTPHRTFYHSTTVQQGLSSLMGIYMVSSGCPVMDKMRPMVEFHLPFATMAETTFRTISMYLMAQFFRKRWGQEVDFELNDLRPLLSAVHEVNVGFSKRLGAAGVEDASINAVVILNNFADMTNYALMKKGLEHWEQLFREFYS